MAVHSVRAVRAELSDRSVLRVRRLLIRTPVGFRIIRLRIFVERGLMNGRCKFTCASAIVPWRWRDALRSVLDKRLQIVNWRSDLVKFHIRCESEIETAVPQRRNREVNFAVV
jgi:hypothetical protein